MIILSIIVGLLIVAVVIGGYLLYYTMVALAVVIESLGVDELAELAKLGK